MSNHSTSVCLHMTLKFLKLSIKYIKEKTKNKIQKIRKLKFITN